MNDAIAKQLANALRAGLTPTGNIKDAERIHAECVEALAAYDAEAKEPAVVIRWSSADMPGRTKKQRRAQLEAIARELEDRCISAGSEFIEDSFD